ncbi:uncharacterized protein LOC121430110 isoform X1 [Lytechinus variegatus]|uniref:uncharacterized protein LOC121430110 isoform X1 n=2 Tax=Lytechinus variegatus TaxID=7654 RepID=UPI001BB19A06|nr:uncharacterized protein LOC121430110 isoform X1 [Lytechinus variegatus]
MSLQSSYHCRTRRLHANSSSSICFRVISLHYSSNILMLLTMRLLVALALCLCFYAPSPVLSFTLPEEKFIESKMPDVGEESTGQNDINSIAKSLIREVFGGADEREMDAEDEGEEAGEMSLSKRTTGSNRPQREIRARAQFAGRRPPITTRSKFTWGKRSSPSMISRPTAEQLLEELQRNAEMSDEWRDSDRQALLNDAALYDNLMDKHQVQKDAFSSFSFGKRGMSPFSFGKRSMPSFAFGKRGLMSSFAFGKRPHGGSAFIFGRRDWEPRETDFESGPFKRGNVAFSFGKRADQ